MDKKKLGILILVVGLLIAVVGGVMLMRNQPLNVPVQHVTADHFRINHERQAARKNAYILGGAGIAVFLLGVGVRISARGRQEALAGE